MFSKTNLAFLFLSVTTCGFHLEVNPLYWHSWRRLLTIDFENDTPTSCRMSLTWLDVVKQFFFTTKLFLQSSTLVVFNNRPCLFVLLSSPVHSFFLMMYQIADLATPKVCAISLIGLFCFCRLMMALQLTIGFKFSSHTQSWLLPDLLNLNIS